MDLASPPPVVVVASAAALPAKAPTAALAGLFVQDESGNTRVPYWTSKGAEPCVLVVHSGTPIRQEQVITLPGVDRIAAEASTACVEHVLFDASREGPDSELGGLEALSVPLFPGGVPEGDDGSMLPQFFAPADMNFDGYTDLKVLAIMGAYNAGFAMFVYDPARFMFVRNAELEGLLWPTFDEKTKTVSSGGRYGGPMYGSTESRWIEGALVDEKEVVSILGEDPNGLGLPPGYTSYQIRRERRGGVMTTVFEGPVR